MVKIPAPPIPPAKPAPGARAGMPEELAPPSPRPVIWDASHRRPLSRPDFLAPRAPSARADIAISIGALAAFAVLVILAIIGAYSLIHG